jgi:hypothetical protein
MPKPLLRPIYPDTNDSVLSLTSNSASKQQQSKEQKMAVARILRKKRSKNYVSAIHHLDAGGHVHNQKQLDDILHMIQEEFPEVALSGILLGIVSNCYLGENYEVHSIDIAGNIIDHFRKGQPMPERLEKARTLALMGGYEFIEVYVDCCRAVSFNGSVSVIKE